MHSSRQKALRAVRYAATTAPSSRHKLNQDEPAKEDLASMDNKNISGGGIKVTYIETQFVTSDEAGFKDLVQRLTGRSAPPPPAPHRPRPCRRTDDGRPRATTTAAAGVAGPPQGYHYTVAEVRRPAVTISRTRTPTYLEDDMGLHGFVDMGDFSDLFYVGASQRSDGYYGGFP